MVYAGQRWCRNAFAGIGASLLLLCAAPALHADERWDTLEAIHSVENPSNSSRPGPYGELGAYQFRQSTWRMHTRLPFSAALDRQTSDQIAVKHYEWLKARLAAAGRSPTPYNIALAWNAGPTAVIQGNVPRAARNYAARVNNLAAELRAREAAAENGSRMTVANQ